MNSTALHALALLGPEYAIQPLVRKYAVFRLRRCADSRQLEAFLALLVQALRYENFESVKAGLHKDFDSATTEQPRREASPPGLVVEDAVKSLLRVQSQPQLTSTPSSSSPTSSTSENCLNLNKKPPEMNIPYRWVSEISTESDLASFLVNKCADDDRLANYFYWYLNVEYESSRNSIAVQEMYLIVLKRFLMKLEHGDVQRRRRFRILQRQIEFSEQLTKLVSTSVVASSASRTKKLQTLKEQLVLPRESEDSSRWSFADFEALPLPLDPDVVVDGLIPGRTEIFKSATFPCKFIFRRCHEECESTSKCSIMSRLQDEDDDDDNVWYDDVSEGLLEGRRAAMRRSAPKCGCLNVYKVIFKVGEDIRQDQFALQMISLFDRIFLDSELDLKVTAFRVLATSSSAGFVEYVDSQSVASINSKHGSLMKYFASIASDKKPIKTIVSNFSKSCAAYCVMTYVLGVGDRHLDNLLVTDDGRLFHVDFAYLFGRDPKQALPLPPIRLTKEMVDAMGGPQSEGFAQFRELCHTAYLVLRR